MLLFLSSLALAQEAPPIVNGEETSDYPAVGALYAAHDNGTGFEFCSGTLVHEKWVITAAHCVEAFEDMERKNFDNFFFAMGTTVDGIDDGEGIDELVSIKAWHAHPDYSPYTLVYDIGILELAEEATTKPVPINDDKPDVDWEVITYVGWGITGDGLADYYASGVKRTVDVPVYRFDAYHIHAYDSEEGKNICQGDSGGAMLYPENDMMMLVGANSYGYNVYGERPNCEDEGSASAATRVDNSLEWLEGYVTLYRTEDLIAAENTADTGYDTGYDTGVDNADDGGTGGSDGGGGGKGCSTTTGGAGFSAVFLMVLGLAWRRERYT